jgi:hypothetical protein
MNREEIWEVRMSISIGKNLSLHLLIKIIYRIPGINVIHKKRFVLMFCPILKRNMSILFMRDASLRPTYAGIATIFVFRNMSSALFIR